MPLHANYTKILFSLTRPWRTAVGKTGNIDFICTDNLIKAHKIQTNAYTGLCITGWWGKTANDRHREVTTAFFSLPVTQSIRFLLALVENDIRKRAWNCFHVAHPKLSACQSRPLPALFHTRNFMQEVEKGDRKFKTSFLCFLLSVCGQALRWKRKVSGGEGLLSQICSLPY